MAREGRPDVAAELACRCVARTLGVPVGLNDASGKQGAHDLILDRDKRSIAIEVKCIVDPQHRAAGNKSSQLGYTRDNRLSYSWIVQLNTDRNWKPALAQLPGLLSDLEQRGYLPSSAHYMWHHDMEMYVRFDDLGIDGVSCMFSTEKHPPGYYVLPASWGGIVPEVDIAVSSACALIKGPTMTKLRKQLSDAETDERHAFLIYGWEYLEAIPFSQEEELPTVAPDLPSGIDGLWLSSTTSRSPTLAWLPDQGWIQAAPLG